jgi:hypothetical protein
VTHKNECKDALFTKAYTDRDGHGHHRGRRAVFQPPAKVVGGSR